MYKGKRELQQKGLKYVRRKTRAMWNLFSTE